MAYSNGNIYMAGYACAARLSPHASHRTPRSPQSLSLSVRMGDLSFHTQHKNGGYTDHAGTRTDAADTHSEVTVHHATGSFASGDFAENATSQYGMDAIIYKVSKNGVPLKVFAADSLPPTPTRTRTLSIP